MDWTDLVPDRDRWWAVLMAVMAGSIKRRDFLE